jgi:hypothetical protein
MGLLYLMCMTNELVYTTELSPVLFSTRGINIFLTAPFLRMQARKDMLMPSDGAAACFR